MNSRFTSGLGRYIDSLLEVKHALGFPYEASQRHLRRFDEMCARDFPGQVALTAVMGKAWAAARPGEFVNTQLRRITPVRQLAKHMVSLGVDAYVIAAGIPGRQIHYRPHLFTPEQLRAIFDAADQIRPTPFGGRRELIIPVIFRMLYCLGLRPGEAIRLHRNDVDLTRGAVYIRQSKGHHDRTVFMSDDLLDYCRCYEAAISAHHPGRIAFFPTRTGACYAVEAISRWFRELLAAATHVEPTLPVLGPRPYDLRHAHVIETINRWSRAGRDPLEQVAYLSMQLGHVHTEDTWYYFHLAADFHPDLRHLANTGIEAGLAEVSRVLP